MDILRAKEIVTALADGINPLTGEILSSDDSCNQAEVVRALYAILEYVNANVDDTKPQKPKPENAGKPWTDTEKKEVEAEYNSGMKISEIARRHGRSRGSIEAKLAQMGVIDYSYFTWKAK